ncbi:MAG: response regulator [Clostridium sp.]|nr:response regulator [Clostridium sp.]
MDRKVNRRVKEERKQRRSRGYWMYLVGVAGVLCVLMAASFYVNYIRESLMSQTISNVQTVTQQQQQAFDSFIARDRERLHSYAVDFSEHSSADIENIHDKLGVFSDIDAVYSVVNLDKGEYYNSKSQEAFPMSEEELELYRSLSGSSVREPFVSLYTDTKMFGYYECFTFTDGVKGLIQKGYESDRVSNEFTLSFYNDRGFAYVINRQGDVLLRPHVDGQDNIEDNIFVMFGESKDGREQLAALEKALDGRETGAEVMMGVRAKDDYVYAYVPIENVDDWYLISIVPRDAIMDEANQAIRSSQTILVVAIVIMTVLAVFVFFMWRTRKALLQNEQEKEYKEQQFHILANYLANNTDDAYIMLKEDKSTIEFVSPNFERVMGETAEGVLPDLQVLKCAGSKLDELKENESLEPMELERTNARTGERKWFQETIYCAYIQEEKKFIVYISDRTTEREIQNDLKTALDTAEVANHAKSTFLSSVSHDIRTPMNAIIGLVTLLQQEADNPSTVLEYAKRMEAASQHLLGLINDVLDMNKIESGKIMLSEEEVNLSELIEELNNIIRPQAKAKEQTMVIYTSAFKYEHLMGDKMRINQILINILSNAVKYTPRGGRIEIMVKELPQAVEGFSRVQFRVKDNGQGMSENYQKVIFDPFTREQNTTTNKIQGTGLGMAITKNLVELMGGTIGVESKLEEGSTFIVELDLRIQDKEDNPEFWKEHGVSRIIVADDDEEICENVVRTMAGTGVTVDYVTDGEEVIGTIREARERGNPYNLILLDWQMPKLSGLEVARLIKANYPHRIPILLFTAYDWADIEEEALKIGIDHFMPKPFFISRFKEAIKRVMYKQSADVSVAARLGESIVKDKHILVVEDIEVNRLVLGKMLKSRGATWDVAENGQQAVELFEGSKPGDYDFILMDVQMPVMDGYHATRKIRGGEHPSAKTIPIIAMTANAFADDVRDAIAAGMDAHVAKPIILEQLEKTIKEVLDKKEQEKKMQV